jgi:hypothetical protein
MFYFKKGPIMKHRKMFMIPYGICMFFASLIKHPSNSKFNPMKAIILPYKKIVLFIFMVVGLQLFLSCVNAQKITERGINPTMKVSNLNLNSENPMQLDRLKIDIKVIGQIAVTTMDMTYYNSNSRIMEGEFNFPLGEGQTVSRFALDINGQLREGVVVEKDKGRKTFEAVVRRGVDPGLLEMTEGNNFRARVYPLPVWGTRRIVIAFEQELTDKGNNDLYLLPLKITEAVKQFSIHVEVVKNQVSLDAGNNEFNNLSFNKWNDSYVANFEQENFTPGKQLALSFPHLNDSTRIFTAIKNTSSDESFFYLNLRPKFFERAKIMPKKVTILWDNSNSSQNRNIEKELSVLNNYIQKIGNLDIELISFNITISKAETYIITEGNWEKLRATLKSMIFDGGTSFGSIDFSKFQGEEILLFSDGLSNFGKPEPGFSNTPVYTINSSHSANHAFLNYLAQRSGGVYVNLNKLSDSEALTLLTNNNYHFISASVEKGKVSNMYPALPCQFSGTFSLAGEISGNEATLLLNFGFGKTIVYSKRILIYKSNSDDPELLRRLWAEKKIAELSLNAEKNKDEITHTGKEFGIVTQNTSLIVLENIGDYLQYDIVPPKEMQDEYFKIKSDNKKDASDQIKKHIDYVVSLSERQSTWWNTNFPIPQEKPVVHNKSGNNRVQYYAPVVVDDNATLDEVVVVNSSNETSAMQDRVSGMQVEVSENAMFVPQEISKKAEENRADIQLNAWDPQTPYLKVLQYAAKGQEYPTYLKLKAEYGSTPAFYIDASDFFSKLGNTDIAVIILSNLAEISLESPQLLRVLGKKLLVMNRNADAVMIFEKLLKLKGEEAQSYRDLGLAYEANGNNQMAINTLYDAVKKEWNGRFPEIELIIMNEINNIISANPKLDYSFINKRLIKKEPIDIRVVLTWDMDNCDMDLWVTDPAGEKCFYSNKLTRLGGKISCDFTGGYGPEEFMIKKAVSGEYSVQSNYFGTRSQTVLAPVNLHLVFITNFGRSNQRKQEVSVRLDNKKDVIDVGKFKFKRD